MFILIPSLTSKFYYEITSLLYPTLLSYKVNINHFAELSDFITR